MLRNLLMRSKSDFDLTSKKLTKLVIEMKKYRVYDTTMR